MHTHSSVGKIARLPYAIREQLNQRLLDGHSGSDILPWLNGLSVVKKILADQFHGQPVTHQNLSNWRAIGFQRWRKAQNPFAPSKNDSLYDPETLPSGQDTDSDAALAGSDDAQNLSQDDLRIAAEFFLRIISDERVKQIGKAPIPEDEKMELMGRHIYGDSWIPRHVADALRAMANDNGGS
jgi:hypothetical protein